MHVCAPPGIIARMLSNPSTLLVLVLVLAGLVVLMAITSGAQTVVIHKLTRELREMTRATGALPAATVELEALEFSGCCRGPLPVAQEIPADGTVLPLIPPSAPVHAEDVARSARRKAARDRVNPDSVTPPGEGH